MAKIKTSETTIVKRSQINLNPINPKRHTAESIQLQKRNIRKVGYLGGIVWNRTTGNLIDGHRRVYALDLLNEYPDKTTDYDLKVEAVELDEKAEKVQLTYMATGNTKYDIDLIADYIRDIDESNFGDLGLSDGELSDILASADDSANVEDFSDFLMDDEQQDETPTTEPTPTTSGTTASGQADGHIYDVKRQIQDKLEQSDDFANAYTLLSFDNRDNKIAFFELLGMKPQRIVKGEDVLRLFE